MGSRNYYVTSKYKNLTNGKISRVSRLNIKLDKIPTGPADYKPIDTLDSSGKYKLAKHSNVSSCVFNRTPRQSLIDKTKLFVPGPG